MKISVITVTYNSSSTIRDTIESLLSQRYTNIEYIIVDGLSKDNTVEIIKEYESQFNGRMLWISEKDNGIYDAMNKGIKLATGDYITILNSDDFFINKDVISNVVEAIKRNKVDVLYTNLFLVDNQNTNKVIRNCKYNQFKKGMFFKGWHPPHPSLFVRNEIYKNYGVFDTKFKIAADYDFMLRIFEKHSITALHLPIYTIKMRNGGASTSSFKRILITQKECLKSFEKYNMKVNMLQYIFGKYTKKLKQYTLNSLIQDFKSKI